jgi:hypothetical protein
VLPVAGKGLGHGAIVMCGHGKAKSEGAFSALPGLGEAAGPCMYARRVAVQCLAVAFGCGYRFYCPAES